MHPGDAAFNVYAESAIQALLSHLYISIGVIYFLTAFILQVYCARSFTFSTVIFSPPHRLRLSDGAETHDLEAPCPLRRSVLPVTDCSLVYLRAISARGIYTNPLSPATRHPSLSRVRGIIILVDLLTRSIQQTARSASASLSSCLPAAAPRSLFLSCTIPRSTTSLVIGARMHNGLRSLREASTQKAGALANPV